MWNIKENLQECLKMSTKNIDYDIGNIDNICDSLPTYLNIKNITLDKITTNCINAYICTLNNDKTINIEAFVDNLVCTFIK